MHLFIARYRYHNTVHENKVPYISQTCGIGVRWLSMKMSYWVEVIATKCLRWVVITIWLTVTKYPYLKWQWICSFLRRFFFFFPLSPTRLVSDLTIYVSNSMVSYKKQELLTLHEHLGSPPVFGRVCVFSVVFVVLLVVVLCIVCPLLSVSLDCPFLIALSVFSNVYYYY